jgi:hypothetical protein
MVKPVAASLLILLMFFTGSPAASAAATPSKAKVHGIALSGRVSRIDPAKMTFAVLDGSGREVALSWTRATKITGGDLKAGEQVTLRYFDKYSKHIAATIRVGPSPSPSPRATTAVTPAPAVAPTRSAAKLP